MIGIDVSDRSLKLVWLSAGKSRRLLSHCVQDLPAGLMESGVVRDSARMQEAIREGLEVCRVGRNPRDAVIASIPETQSFLRVVEVPTMAEDEVDEAVQWEVAQHIPYGLENVYIDWEPIVSEGHAPAQAHQEILVGAAQKKVIDPLYEVFRGLGVDIAAFELESQAMVRALISDDLRHKQGMLLVDLGGASTNVVIHDHGTIRFTASLQKGSDRMRDTLASQEIQMINETPDSIPPAMAQSIEGKLSGMYQELVMEVNGIVEFYNGIDVQHEVREIILAGGGSNFPGLGRAFLRVFDNVHIQRGNPWASVLLGQVDRKAPMSLDQSVRFATALGLALRPILI